MKKLLAIAICLLSFNALKAQTVKAEDLIGSWKMYFPGGPNGEFNDTLNIEYEAIEGFVRWNGDAI